MTDQITTSRTCAVCGTNTDTDDGYCDSCGDAIVLCQECWGRSVREITTAPSIFDYDWDKLALCANCKEADHEPNPNPNGRGEAA